MTIYTLGLLLGAYHVMVGLMTLHPVVSVDYHREMRKNYNTLAHSLKFLHPYVDRITLALYTRYFLAFLQMIAGTLLMENGHFTKGFGRVGNNVLILTNLVMLGILYQIGAPYDRVGAASVFTIMLIARRIIIHYSSQKLRVGVKTRSGGKPKTSTPKKNKNE